MFYFTDSLPFPQIIFSILCHVVYLQNFSARWPVISLTSLSFVASCILVVADHFLWFFYFAKVSQEARHTAHRGGPQPLGFADIATFFGVCVWLAPLFLFLSLSAGDNALPTSGTLFARIFSPAPDYVIDPLPSSPAITAHPRAITTVAPTSLFKSLFSVIPFIQRKPDRSEGLIAPRTPTIPPPSPSFSRPPSMPPSPSIGRRSTLPPPPLSPRSPGGSMFGQMAREPSISSHLSPDGFQLAAPPARRERVAGLGPSPILVAGRGGPARRVTADGGIGLGLMKRSSSSLSSGKGYD